MTARNALLICAAALVLAVPTPANAAPLVFIGTGTFSPGIPTVGCANQTMTFDATVVSSPGVVLGTTHFDGSSSLCETLLAGRGSGVFTGAVRCAVTYDRMLFQIRFTGQDCSYDCTLTPTSWNPWTSYVIDCGAPSETR